MRELRGAEAANAICTDAMRQTAELIERGIVPCLGVVRIGDDAADAAYERGIRKRFDAAGAKVESICLSADSTQEEAEEAIAKLAADDSVHGILLFMPLPKQCCGQAAWAAAARQKRNGHRLPYRNAQPCRAHTECGHCDSKRGLARHDFGGHGYGAEHTDRRWHKHRERQDLRRHCRRGLPKGRGIYPRAGRRGRAYIRRDADAHRAGGDEGAKRLRRTLT